MKNTSGNIPGEGQSPPSSASVDSGVEKEKGHASGDSPDAVEAATPTGQAYRNQEAIGASKSLSDLIERTTRFRLEFINHTRGELDSVGDYVYIAWCDGILFAAKLIATLSASLQRKLDEETAIVDRVWKALGIATYEQAGGKAIDEIVSSLLRKNQELREKLQLILPLARGYAAIHQVGNNNAFIQEVADLLSGEKNKANERLAAKTLRAREQS